MAWGPAFVETAVGPAHMGLLTHMGSQTHHPMETGQSPSHAVLDGRRAQGWIWEVQGLLGAR